MRRTRTTFGIDGFTAAEAAEGIPALREELDARQLLAHEAHWDEDTKQVVVMVETKDFGPRTSKVHQDIVWDCVIACINFSGKGIRFNKL